MSAGRRLGLVGIGEMAVLHAEAALRNGAALCIASGRDPARAAALASRLGAQAYPSYDALLADPSVGALILCVPTHAHRAYALRALEAGKHLLCEKPIALTLQDADAMIQAADAAGVRLAVAHTLRFWPEYRRMREALLAGSLGTPRWFGARRLTGVLAKSGAAAAWRADPALGGGAVIDLQIHDLDYICWLLGAPASVYAYGLRSASGTWDHLVTTLGYGSGLGASVEASFVLPGDPLEIVARLLTDRFSVTYEYAPEHFALHGLRGGGARKAGLVAVGYRPNDQPAGLWAPPPGEIDPFAAALGDQIAAFLRCAYEGAPPACSGREARLALAVALAARASCETGAVVRGPFTPTPSAP